ncbi:lipid-A-disaccharide synthase [Cytophagaceae bacterium 50C-KIRBA]|uniref:Lipid-A-disaccharide synthase n=1 Tax=Aquirufa beregesia TaxID=2516556 RepID=A0ABX0ERU1_9BACT|nr:lipid-A-disaccharide synthase [Aquirufa beregesia]NGZ43089.1 lipid-A-disaccharide synthase [Aquirufa beregesia]
MKYFILAGEKSGDLHGSKLIKELLILDPTARIQAWGGDDMLHAGAEVLIHHKELAIMGLLGVLQNIQRLKGLFQKFKNQIQQFQPDTIIFIDYGGFNLKAARIAKLQGFHTQFYIAPKVWAWNKGRVDVIKKWVDQLYVIFPFEKKLFEAHGISTHYVGNPLKDSIDDFQPNPLFAEQHSIKQPCISLLAGSRKQEISAALPVFQEIKYQFPDLHFYVAGLKEWKSIYEAYHLDVIYDDTYNLLQVSQVAIVTSGTATLETALFKIPQIVVYKTDWLFYSLAKLLVKIKFISLVNIILGKEAVPEMIQSKFTTSHISLKLNQLLEHNSTSKQKQMKLYDELAQIIGPAGASKKTAKLIFEYAVAFQAK